MWTVDPLWYHVDARLRTADVHDKILARVSDVVILSCLTVTASVTAQLTRQARLDCPQCLSVCNCHA